MSDDRSIRFVSDVALAQPDEVLPCIPEQRTLPVKIRLRLRFCYAGGSIHLQPTVKTAEVELPAAAISLKHWQSSPSDV